MATFSQEETDQMIKAFKEMGVKPDLEDTESFKHWLQNFGDSESDKGSASVLYSPKISIFSGDTKDTSFDLWKYEVSCLLSEKTYSRDAIKQALRKSLKGEAAKIAMRMGPSATLEELLEKMEGIYGTVEVGETLLAQFYNASQKPNEDVASWGCRVEDLLEKVRDRGQVKGVDMAEMLRTRFWAGLKQSIKNVCGHIYESCTDFDKLRVSLRRIEQEYGLNPNIESNKQKVKQVSCKTAQNLGSLGYSDSSQADKSEISELKGLVNKLSSKIDHLEGSYATNVTGEYTRGSHASSSYHKGPAQGNDTSYSRYNYTSQYKGQGRGSGSYNTGRGAGTRNNKGTFVPRRPSRSNDQTSSRNRNDRGEDQYTQQGEPICRRCNQPGHIELGCRVILDHLRNLNVSQPMSGARR